ncbi:hypothetical protein BC835DRAFT_1360672 [Cytidiella melzeri]|nr:hypothetical protein BC835DRAFT_1360672 [Cytidiella melzeri]
MLSRCVFHLQAASRLAVAKAPGRPSARLYSQGGDTLDQSRQSGYAASKPQKSSPADAANSEGGKKATRGSLSGNQEGVGFADQVGSQSASGSGDHAKPGSAEGRGGEENITPPSFADAVKSKLGFKTTAGEDKQNRGGGKGVTGTGNVTYDRAKRTMHTSAGLSMPANTKGQAPEGSQQPKNKTYADQNAHLKHKSRASAPDSGKGNAAKDPKLPSHEVQGVTSKSSNAQKRGFYTSAVALKDDKEGAHTAESYFKDVDDTQPVNSKMHQVDSSSETASVAHANEHPVTGQSSKSGAGSREYESIGKDEHPYDTPPTKGSESEQKLRYGGQPGLSEPSKPGEGPSGEAAGGRKPE